VPGSLPAQVEEFIKKYIQSLEELEVLLTLSDSPDKTWTAATVYDAIKSSPVSVAQRLERLAANGLINLFDAPEHDYKFNPTPATVAEAVHALGAAYREKRLKVIEFLFSQPISPLQSFSDAFKIRKDPNHG
jgi:hypothetical protein